MYIYNVFTYYHRDAKDRYPRASLSGSDVLGVYNKRRSMCQCVAQ